MRQDRQRVNPRAYNEQDVIKKSYEGKVKYSRVNAV
jgi:hypothetical protein